MTYAQFLLIFLVAPLMVVALVLRRRLLDRRYLTLLGVLAVVAVAYMAPWDHTAAVWNLWTWSRTQTWGIRWWAVPPEEYLFCVLEALLGVTLTYAAMRWLGHSRQSGDDRGERPDGEEQRG